MFTSLLKNVEVNSLIANEDEYIKGVDIYCTNCNTRRTLEVEFAGIVKKVRCLCKCQAQKREQEERLKEEEEKMARIEKRRVSSLMGEKYRNVSFDTTETTHNASFASAFNRCVNFTKNIEQVLENGLGMYLYGASGCGKTHLTACIANSLMNKRIDVIFTNFFEISKEVRATFSDFNKSESEVINKYKSIPVLFLDDLGTESLAKNSGDNFTQNLIFEIINYRYNEKKTTVFTSNYSLSELVVDRNMEVKTVDRIKELASAVIFIDGTSYRAKAKEKMLPF